VRTFGHHTRASTPTSPSSRCGCAMCLKCAKRHKRGPAAHEGPSDRLPHPRSLRSRSGPGYGERAGRRAARNERSPGGSRVHPLFSISEADLGLPQTRYSLRLTHTSCGRRRDSDPNNTPTYRRRTHTSCAPLQRLLRASLDWQQQPQVPNLRHPSIYRWGGRPIPPRRHAAAAGSGASQADNRDYRL
jgi:hypothetical protein